MSVGDEIHAQLVAAFAGADVQVINESHKHAGHAGDDGTGESHFAVAIRADVFGPMGRIARHRAVHQALGAALIARIHALELDISG